MKQSDETERRKRQSGSLNVIFKIGQRNAARKGGGLVGQAL